MRKTKSSVIKNARYYVLFSFIAINILISAQSLTPSTASAELSDSFGAFFSGIVNFFSPAEANLVNPETIDLQGFETIYIGQSKRITPLVLPENTTDKTVTWRSSDTDIAEVTTGGIVVAKEFGNATITAQTCLDNVFATLPIEVIDFPDVTSFEISSTVSEMMVGLSTKISVSNVLPELAKLETIDWSSSDVDVASVSQEGVVHGEDIGSVTITASAGSFIRTLIFNIVPNTIVIVMPESLTITGESIGYVNRYTQLSVDFGLTIPTDTSVSWHSSNSQIATVDNTGKVYGFKFDGLVTITAISNADETIFDDFEMEFFKVMPIYISLRVADLNVHAGSTSNVEVTFNPVDTTDRQVIWTSSDESVARIASGTNNNGVITGIKEGVVTITARSVMDEDLTALIEINIVKATALNEAEQAIFNSFLRKAVGHFSLYFLNGLFGIWTIYFFIKFKYNFFKFLLSIGIGTVLAAFSEILQFFTPGRSFTIQDIIINYSGYLFANILFALAVYFILLYQKRKALL